MPEVGRRAAPAHILVVEDEAGMRTLLATLLEAEGYQVETADSGESALRRLRAAECDLLLTDLRMPGIDGLELLRQARRLRPDLAVIMVTGYATVDNAVAALRRGVDDYLTKPFDIDQLRRTVARTLRNRRLRDRSTEALQHLHQANRKLRSLKGQLEEEVVQTRQNLLSVTSALQKHRRELDTLSDVSQALTSTLDLDRLLGTCLDLVVTEMGVEKASIMLLEPPLEEESAEAAAEAEPASAVGPEAADDNASEVAPTDAAPGVEPQLVVRASVGPSAVDIVGERVRLGEGIAGWVARECQPLLIENVNEAPLAQAARRQRPGPQDRGYKDVSLICVPLIAKGRMLGVINVNDKANGRPFDQEDVSLLSTIAGQVAVTIENARLYEQLRSQALRTVQALVVTLEAKDAYTSGHSQRVTRYASAIGRSLRLAPQELTVLRYAAQLHDIGKIGITEDILHKPGPLNHSEWQVIRRHPVISERIIQPLDFLDSVKEVVRHHHERWDGHGYPDGLTGDHLPLLTRILGVADAYDAMTTRRPYRLQPLKPQEAVAEIRRCQGSQFDPQVVQAIRGGDVFVDAGGVA